MLFVFCILLVSSGNLNGECCTEDYMKKFDINNGHCQKEGHNKLIVKCLGGYYLNGSRELTCQDGSWNLPIPNCGKCYASAVSLLIV